MHKGAHRCVCLCVCARALGQAARRLLSPWVRRAREAGEARRSFEVLFSPETSIRPKEICHVVPPFWVPFGGGEGYLFLFAVDISIRTHTLVCSRPVKVTKKFVWPCCESLSSPLSLSLPGLGQKVGQAVVLAQFLTGPTSSCIHPPLGFTLVCSAYHWFFVQNLPDPRSPSLPFISLCTSWSSLPILPPGFPPPPSNNIYLRRARYAVGSACHSVWIEYLFLHWLIKATLSHIINTTPLRSINSPGQ